METWLGYSEVFSVRGIVRCLSSGELLIHTGAIDGMWRLYKGSVPTSLRSREGDGICPNIMKFTRQWQWRWHQNKDDLLTKLGQKLSHRL